MTVRPNKQGTFAESDGGCSQPRPVTTSTRDTALGVPATATRPVLDSLSLAQGNAREDNFDGRDRQVRGAGRSDDRQLARGPVNEGVGSGAAAEYATGPPSDFDFDTWLLSLDESCAQVRRMARKWQIQWHRRRLLELAGELENDR